MKFNFIRHAQSENNVLLNQTMSGHDDKRCILTFLCVVHKKRLEIGRNFQLNL